MTEAKRVAAADEDALLGEVVERREGPVLILLRELDHQLERKHAAMNRQRFPQRPAIRVQLSDARIHRGGEPDRPGGAVEAGRDVPDPVLVANRLVVDEVSAELGAVERAPAGDLAHVACEASDVLDVAEERLDELLDLAAVQTGEEEAGPASAHGRDRRFGANVFVRPERDDQEHRRPGAFPGEARQHGRRSLVAALDVVDEEREPSPPGDGQDPVGDGALDAHALLGRVRCGLRQGHAGYLGEELGEHVPEYRGVPFGGGFHVRTGALPERRDQVADHVIGTTGGGLAADLRDDRSTDLRLEGDFPQQAALPGAGLSLDERRVAGASHRVLHAALHHLHLVLAADHRRAREEPLLHLDVGVGLQLTDGGEALDHLGRARRPAHRIEAEERQHELVHRGRHVVVHVRRRNHRALPGAFEVVEGADRIRHLAGEELIRERAEGVEIGATVEGHATHALRGDVGEGAGDVPRRTDVGQNAEVDQLRVPVGRAAHVSWGQVAVDDPANVEEREGPGHVAEQPADLFYLRLADQVLEVLPVEELHRVERAARRVHRVVVDLDDPRVGEVRQGVELAAEAELGPLSFVLPLVGSERLDRHGAIFGLIPRLEDLPHTAPSEGFLHSVAASGEG